MSSGILVKCILIALDSMWTSGLGNTKYEFWFNTEIFLASYNRLLLLSNGERHVC